MRSAPRVRDLLAALARAVPFDKAAEWDPVGLQVGDPDRPVARAAVCHEATEAVVEAVEADPVDLLVAYHPLLFEPTRSFLAGLGPEGRALRLARAGAALAVVHTAYDAAPGGAADALADALELERVEGFAPLAPAGGFKLATFLPEASADPLLDALVAAGAGRIGDYTHCSFRAPGTGTFYAPETADPHTGRRGALNREPEVRLEVAVPAARRDAVLAALAAAHPYEEPAYDLLPRQPETGLAGRVGSLPAPLPLPELAARAARALDAPHTRWAGPETARPSRIAVVPGSGGDFVEAARDAGAEALVTGDLSHHRARAALDAGLYPIDPGHAPTERPGLQRLFATVAAQAPETASLLHLDPHPWNPPD